MYILINFGYRSRKIFTIDCLAAAVFDCIWEHCYKQLSETYNNKQTLFAKQVEEHQLKIENNEKKLESVLAKLKEEQEKEGGTKKQDKKAAKKGGKDAPVASSPLEQEKIDLEKEIEFSKTALTKYEQKKTKIEQLKTKLEQIKQKVVKEEVEIELVDKTGERKFIKTKLEQQASSFLSDKGIYYLCTVAKGEQEEVQAITHEGFPLRTVEEDTQITGQQEVFSVKKDDKGKKGGKKK